MTISAKIEYTDGGDSKGGTVYTATLTSPTTVTIKRDGRVIERDATWGPDGITGGSGLSEMSDDAYDALCLALARAESGAALAARREAAGLSQAALASRLDVARETVVRWEAGERAIPRTAQIAIDAVLTVAADPNGSTPTRDGVRYWSVYRQIWATARTRDEIPDEEWAAMTSEERTAIRLWLAH